MALPQTTYGAPGIAYEGLVQEAIEAIPALVNAEVSAAIPFGVMVAFGSGANDMLLLAASTDKLAGILEFGHNYDRLTQLDDAVGKNGGIKIDVAGTVMRKGLIWVWTEEAVAKGDPLFVRYASGAGGTVVGRFRKSAVASETIDLTNFGAWQSKTTAAGLALVSISLQ